MRKRLVLFYESKIHKVVIIVALHEFIYMIIRKWRRVWTYFIWSQLIIPSDLYNSKSGWNHIQNIIPFKINLVNDFRKWWFCDALQHTSESSEILLNMLYRNVYHTVFNFDRTKTKILVCYTYVMCSIIIVMHNWMLGVVTCQGSDTPTLSSENVYVVCNINSLSNG